jgi:glutathione S-transferase
MKLYFAPNTSALASHLALDASGLGYELVPVNFSRSEQRSAAYLALNPKGRVPLLLTAQGALTETPAILTYIAHLAPGKRLLPLDNPWLYAKAQEFNAFLCATLHVAHAHRMRGNRWVDDEQAILAMQRKVPQTVGDAFGQIESAWVSGPWVLGDAYSVCDMYLFTMAQWMEADGVDPALYPRVLDHRERMGSRAEVKSAIAAELALE